MAMHWRECASVCYVRTYNGLGCKECMYVDTDCPKLKKAYKVESPYEIETLILQKKKTEVKNNERFTDKDTGDKERF